MEELKNKGEIFESFLKIVFIFFSIMSKEYLLAFRLVIPMFNLLIAGIALKNKAPKMEINTTVFNSEKEKKCTIKNTLQSMSTINISVCLLLFVLLSFSF